MMPLFGQKIAVLSRLSVVCFCIGLTRGSVLLSLLQWFGRSNVLFLILQSISEVRRPPSPLTDKGHNSASRVRSHQSAEPSSKYQRLESCNFNVKMRFNCSCGATGLCQCSFWRGRWLTWPGIPGMPGPNFRDLLTGSPG